MQPAATAARKPPAAMLMSMVGSRPFVRGRAGASRDRLALRLHGVQGGREPLLLAVIAGPLPEARPTDAGRAVTSSQLAGCILAEDVVDGEVLGDDHIAL